MSKLKQLIAKNFESFTYFYLQLHYRLFLLLVLSIGVGVLDGFGLAMFMPLLEMINEAEQYSGNILGNLKFIVDGLQSLGLNLTLFTVLMVMVVFFTSKGIVKFSVYAYNAIIQQYFIRKLREQMLFAFNRLHYKYFVTSDVGRIQNTMSGEVERVSSAFGNYALAMEQAVLVVVYMGFAFIVDFRFALLVTVGGWLTNFSYKVIYKLTKGTSRKFTKDSHLYQGQIIQYVANFKYLKATAFLSDYAERLRKSIHLIEQSRRKMGILNAILMAAREPLLIVVVAGVIIIQTRLLQLPLGPILVSLLFFYRALAALVNMQNRWNNFLMVSGSLENVVDFQEEMRKNRERNGKVVIQSFKDCLELKDAAFAYDTVPILQDINLQILKNETVAFAGASGSGKTTLVNILAGLMSVDEGALFIDGHNRKDIDIHSYQKRMGYITQEAVIFNDTIFNNVTFWDEPNKESQTRFEEALQKAAIAGFVNGLPKGCETLLGNNGINLSGGQKQRISIARELYRDIDILIMDEATSALDTETEKAIQNSIDILKGQYTILIVAHRLSTICNADRIVLMSCGRIKAVGSYEELMTKTETFKRMVELQDL